MLDLIAQILFCFEVLLRKVGMPRKIRELRKKKEKILDASRKGYRKNMAQVGFPPDVIPIIKDLLSVQKEVVIADIDHDGLFLSKFPLFPGATCVSEETFTQRKKYEIKLVITDGYVGVRKSYKSKQEAFLTELICLNVLVKAGCNVPSILDIDFDEPAITIAYIEGEVIREALVRCGARLRERDFDRMMDEYARSGYKGTKRELRALEGSKYVSEIMDQDYLQRMAFELSRIFSAGVVVQDVKYGNILTEGATGLPFFIDFEGAEYCFYWWGHRALAKRQAKASMRLRSLFSGVV